uniref:Uncharacterized protein n=1 Tax=Geospiza parvula TaxID=87175 RepID=A0A8C3MYW2_GEOPR
MSSLGPLGCCLRRSIFSSMDHLLHLPGRADSAYSSFSGGSNIPENPTPSCHGDYFCVPPEQAPYMDSEYVTGIYNLSAAHSALRSPQPSKLRGDHAGEQITRQATPMLYYLSAGKTSSVLHPTKDSRSSPKEIPSSSSAASAQLAQKKVLKETSFKRKDLQMSLPVRLRQKSSKRPSVEHLRSFSLSSAKIRRPQKGQAGGRKRVTQEQKKLCYSEPEKRRDLENRGKAFSSSSVSRTELKQIQHSALIKYMERKTSQRPGGSQHLPLHKPPLQERLSNPKGPPGQISNPNGSRKMQNDEVFCQLLSEQKSPDIFSPLPFAPPLNKRNCLLPYSFCDPEKDGPKNDEHKDITGHECGQDKQEQTPETSIPVPRGGNKESAGVEEECRTQSLHPEQHQPATSPEQGMHLHTAPAQPHQGHKHPAKGLLAQETSMHNSHDDAPLEGDTHLPQRRLQHSEDQRYQELALEIIAKDSSLVDILMPHPLRKTALDLMEGLFPVNISMLDKSLTAPVIFYFFFLQLELMASLQSRLQALWEEQELVLLEVRECAKWGEELEVLVRDLCKPQEFERYMMFIGDLEKVLSLLLCLSSRLARVQNALSRMDGNTEPEEKQSLNERHQLLSRQREDAKDLKENLDRRERVVSGILAKYLTEQQLQDYQHFVQVKTSLLIEQKDLEEQIKFFEEQLENLNVQMFWDHLTVCNKLPWGHD